MNTIPRVLRPSPPLRRRVRLAAVAAGLAVAAMLAWAPGAFAFFGPVSPASPNARQISTLYDITLYIALVIFVAVEGALIYALFRFRARKGWVAAQIRGNTNLEIGWTLAAAVVLVVLAVITFAKLASIEDPPDSGPAGENQLASSGVLVADSTQRLPPNGRALRIQVNGQQYIWRYTYTQAASNPDGLDAPYSYEEMVVPTDTTVLLDVVAQDVVHSWWIPALGGKLQAIPGYHNYGWFKIDKPGIYRGQCATLCGRLHARMIATVRAVPPAQFDAWLAQRKRDIAAANAAAQAARAKLNAQTGAGQVLNP